jgi:hypothetical protein
MFDMLDFAVQYRLAIDKITSDQSADLHQFELSYHDWDIAKQLCSVLKVSIYILGPLSNR